MWFFYRVSFGSSKGSMVETLIYETPVQEEPEPTPSQKSFNDKNDETDSSYSTYVLIYVVDMR